VILAELSPRPSATIAEIRDIVEAGDKDSEPSYSGHDPDVIAKLFPDIRAFEMPALPPEATWRVFFKICIEECEFSESWIDSSLAQTLHSVCDLDPDRIPYRVLCRSVFDTDPTSFFLALYRCLENLYAFAGAQKLASELGITASWSEVAAALENQLGWYPREESSLETLLRMANVEDLRSIRSLLGETDDTTERELMANRAARSIYSLRNSIVHFRPAQQLIDLQKINWNAICRHMASILIYMYSELFPGY